MILSVEAQSSYYSCIKFLWLNNRVCGPLPCAFGLLSVEKLTDFLWT